MWVVPCNCVISQGRNCSELLGNGSRAIENRGKEFGGERLRRENFIEVFIFEGGGINDFAECRDREETGGANEIFGIGWGWDIFGEGGEYCGGDFIIGAEVEVGWVETIGGGEQGYVKGHVRDLVGSVLKEPRCYFNVRVLKGGCNNDAIEWLFTGVGDTNSICSNGLDVVLFLILDFGYLGNGMVQANGGI